ncbi:hypothetical protein OsJ_15753 [Oryza sativa Japonica Group]|uniref:Uncharacterized protein n=1 Tax=Oryza sativa subsp. japonica TaxID=39947 RepID=B9FBX5_ORYSJ|nr:hypothetical protein OsJ_15753 [Oryza sativa Japonica Group]
MAEEGGDDGEADVDASSYGRRTTTARGGGAAAMASSCWGRLGLAALWHRLRQLSVARRRRRHGGGGGGRSILGAGGLNYDPLSYAQNFDDGCLEPDFTVTARKKGDEKRWERICQIVGGEVEKFGATEADWGAGYGSNITACQHSLEVQGDAASSRTVEGAVQA